MCDGNQQDANISQSEKDAYASVRDTLSAQSDQVGDVLGVLVVLQSIRLVATSERRRLKRCNLFTKLSYCKNDQGNPDKQNDTVVDEIAISCGELRTDDKRTDNLLSHCDDEEVCYFGQSLFYRFSFRCQLL